LSRPILILGGGGGVHDVLDVIEAINRVAPAWTVAGLLDDARESGSRHLGLEVLGPLREAPGFPDHALVNAIWGDRSYRRLPAILGSTSVRAERFATLVHPAASISSRARLGCGVVVQHGVTVGGGTVVGDFATLCPGSTVGHDARIGDFTILAPQAVVSGSVTVERNCYIGAAAVIRQKLRIGERSLVGMGAVVVRDVDPGVTVVGNPARLVTPSGERARPRDGEEVLR
jgi:sugar O-acyltransferase (sialic acid O-acetyltransferase NeuD family)